MRPLNLAISLVISLTTVVPAGARTPGAVCRRECAPRIAEQCGGLAGRELKRCRKPLVKACKLSTPQIACESTEALTGALADQALRDGDGLDLSLCADGRFARGIEGEGIQFGTWRVALVDGALAVELSPGATDESDRVSVARDASAALTVDGAPVTLDDVGPECDPVVTPDPTALLVEAARDLTDRRLVTNVLRIGGSPSAERRDVTLCSDGRFLSTFDVTDAGVIDTDTRSGTWSLAIEDGSPVLQLAAEDGDAETLAIRTGATVVLDGVRAVVSDARAVCDAPPPPPPAPDPVDEFTAALQGTAWFFTVPSGNFLVRVKMGLCDTGRHLTITTTTKRGPWAVELVDDVPSLVLRDDGGATLRTFALSFADDGSVLLNGTIAPIDEPSLVDAACE